MGDNKINELNFAGQVENFGSHDATRCNRVPRSTDARSTDVTVYSISALPHSNFQWSRLLNRKSG